MIRRSARLAPVSKERSDGELMALVARGDVSALGEIYDRHGRSVWRVVYRITQGSADVDDLVQRTFLELPKIAPSYDGRASCRAWLCGIAVRLVSRWHRSLRRMVQRLSAFRALEHDAERRTPENDASDNEQFRALASAVDALSARKREVFVLIEIEGLSADEVAVVLDVPAATIRTRLFHAKRELRAAIKRSAP